MTIHCFYMGLKTPRKIPFSPLNWLTLIFIISHLIPQVTFLQSLPFCLYLFKFSLTLTILWLHRRIILWILLFSPNSLFQTLFIYFFLPSSTPSVLLFATAHANLPLSLSLPSYWEKKRPSWITGETLTTAWTGSLERCSMTVESILSAAFEWLAREWAEPLRLPQVSFACFFICALVRGKITKSKSIICCAKRKNKNKNS